MRISCCHERIWNNYVEIHWKSMQIMGFFFWCTRWYTSRGDPTRQDKVWRKTLLHYVNTNWSDWWATLDLDDEKYIENSINIHSNHPSINLIHKHSEHHTNFSFKHLNPSEVGTIHGKLNTKKAMVVMTLRPNSSKLQLLLYQSPYLELSIMYLTSLNFPPKLKLLRLVPSIKRTVSWTKTTIDL